jgi:hypothetical protein
MPIDFNLEADDIAFSTRYPEIPADVVALYSSGSNGIGPCAVALQEVCGDKVAALHRMLGTAMSLTAETLIDHLGDSFFVDVRTHKAPDQPFQMLFVVPVGSVAVTLDLRPPNTLHSDEYERRNLQPIPIAFRPLVLAFEHIIINLASPAYVGVGEVEVSCHPSNATSITEFVKGRARLPLESHFQDLDRVRVFSHHNVKDWFTCFDENAQDQALWLICDGGRTVARLHDPAAAYDAMGMHYLSGQKEPFDFRPFTE